MLVGIAHPFRTHRANWHGPTIQPNITHSNQATGWGHSDWDYPPLRILDSGTDIRSRGSGQKIDNHTGVNPQGPIGTIIPYTNSASNCDISTPSSGRWTSTTVARHDMMQRKVKVKTLESTTFRKC